MNTYLINFYVPESDLESVKQALFEAGAGKFGGYECCSWQTKGSGQFLPQKGSEPFIGEIGKVENVDEYKVELICSEKNIKQAIAALKDAHPYEQPAYSVIKMENY